MTCDVAVIGAGIVGAACADSLSQQGLRVAIIEADIIGGGATAAGMGHLLVLDTNEPEFGLTRYSVDRWNELKPRMPPEVEWDGCGTLWVAADEEEMAEVRRKHTFYAERSVSSEILDSESLAEAEPNLRPGLAGGLLVHHDALIYAPRAAVWFVERAVSRGAMLIRSRVESSGQDGIRLAGGEVVSAGATICASGASAVEFVPTLDMRPRKGHLAITDRYPGFVRHALIELGYIKSVHGNATESVAFNAQPRKSGQVLIGSSRQFGVTQGTVDSNVLSRMLRQAMGYMPAIANLSVVRTWTGFRSATADKLPYIGQVRDKLFVATGHEGIGITTSLGSAALLTDLILKRSPCLDPAPFSPLR